MRGSYSTGYVGSMGLGYMGNLASEKSKYKDSTKMIAFIILSQYWGIPRRAMWLLIKVCSKEDFQPHEGEADNPTNPFQWHKFQRMSMAAATNPHRSLKGRQPAIPFSAYTPSPSLPVVVQRYRLPTTGIHMGSVDFSEQPGRHARRL